MNEMQKRIIMKLSGDPELLKEFLEMTSKMEAKPVPTDKTISLYVVKRHTEDGAEYYHPVVAPTSMTAEPETYTMIADESMVKLQDTYADNVARMAGITRERPIIITIPEKTYNELKEKLIELVTAIYRKIDEAAEALDGISALTGSPVPVGMLKGMMTSQIMSNMKVTGHCLNENYGIEEKHDYIEDHVNEECDDCDCCCGCDCDCDCCDEECDNCDCDCGGDCDECEDCDSYGDCPCTR